MRRDAIVPSGIEAHAQRRHVLIRVGSRLAERVTLKNHVRLLPDSVLRNFLRLLKFLKTINGFIE